MEGNPDVDQAVLSQWHRSLVLVETSYITSHLIGVGMKFTQELEEGIFLKRYKRFFADIRWQGETIVAHVANTGSLKSCNDPEQACLFSVSDNPERKLKYSLEMIRSKGGAWVGVNTSIPNKIVMEALEKKLFSHWQDFDQIQHEVKISAETRLDFVLKKTGQEKFHYIEVKNVTLAVEGVAQFPDAVTTRGQKHLIELMKLIEQGHSCEIIFTVQRNDCHAFSAALEIDPEYAKLLHKAVSAGLRVTPAVVDLSPREVKLSSKLLPLL